MALAIGLILAAIIAGAGFYFLRDRAEVGTLPTTISADGEEAAEDSEGEGIEITEPQIETDGDYIRVELPAIAIPLRGEGDVFNYGTLRVALVVTDISGLPRIRRGIPLLRDALIAKLNAEPIRESGDGMPEALRRLKPEIEGLVERFIDSPDIRDLRLALVLANGREFIEE